MPSPRDHSSLSFKSRLTTTWLSSPLASPTASQCRQDGEQAGASPRLQEGSFLLTRGSWSHNMLLSLAKD